MKSTQFEALSIRFNLSIIWCVTPHTVTQTNMGQTISEVMTGARSAYLDAAAVVTWSSVLPYAVLLGATWLAYRALLQPLLSPLRKVGRRADLTYDCHPKSCLCIIEGIFK